MLRKPLGAAKRPLVVRRFARVRVVRTDAAADDLSIVMQAECDDNVLPPAPLTTSAEVVRQSPGALLNNANRPLLVPLLSLLRRRGAYCGSHTRQELVRYLVPSVHRERLPWLWDDSAEPKPSSLSSSTPAAAATSPSSSREVKSTSVLRSLPSFLWRATVERGKPIELGEQLHYWHQVLFALSANPAFAEVESFDEAHRDLLSIIQDYYTDIVHVQRHLPPLDEDTVMTRMPPVLIRKLRKLYVEQYRLLQYAELIRAVVDGEELVMPDCGTALLNDAEVFEYFLTIPGRRESGLERNERWARTLECAAFAFEKLFRLWRWQQIAVSTAVVRPAALLMNVCVFARNDNAEGERYREAILAVMRVFHAQCVNGGRDYNGGDDKADAACDVLRALRDAGVESMLAKCKRLHFGPMSGLLNVCTVASVTEMLLCDETGPATEARRGSVGRDELEVLLSPRKIVGSEMYDVARGDDRHRFAAHYGLLNLSARVGAALQAVVQSPTSMRRYSGELGKWCAFIGRPLRLNISDVPLAQQVSGNSVPSWQCGCQSVNPVQAKSVSCIGCVSRDLVRHKWTCPHCSWAATSGDRINTCLGCQRPHPRQLAVHDGAEITVDKEPATPLLWYCEWCFSYSSLSCDGVGVTPSCDECGAVCCGWPTSYFEWECGCGAANSSARRWCRVCSANRKQACCVCATCQKEWMLQPHGVTAASAVPSAGGTSCPFCSAPHPRDAAAWQRRLLRCPFCHRFTPGDASASCQNCHQRIGVLRQFLPLHADWPWLCHTCGHRHHHRGTDGTLLPPPDDATEACQSCGTLRLDPVLFDFHEPWTCAGCGEKAARGFNCHRCLSLHPAVPATEVHAWRCIVCLSVNNSWSSSCQRWGCGTQRSADATVLPYSPWRCSRCGEHSLTAQVPQCEHCGSVRGVVTAAAESATAAYPDTECTGDEKRARRLAEVEALLASAAAVRDDNDAPDKRSAGSLTDDWARCVAYSVQLAIPLS
ncbi:hypothetical protein DQ04_00331010 [Trypanosoma grayi]|uniref:hypothetical protein n=1 Tax=Trypanosoma grayi TaxID=71804 RepID=UPI0004F43BDD|nr:hypothetical protein DQ04_00331010 [Trypanosoma grayi]KEG14708.1 hypothetical protein DQ04_00331010 [Trypanosoma grayi]